MEKYKNLLIEEKRKFWQKHIEGWKLSGQSQAEYCREQQLKKSALTIGGLACQEKQE